jgi:deoxyribonuclease IV
VLFGAHVSSAGGISNAIDRAEQIGCDAVQVFTQSPRMWRPTAHIDEQLARFRERREQAGIAYVSCHALYLVNLASPDGTLRRKSVTALRDTLETAAAIDAEGVVFHPGSHLGAGLKSGLGRIVRALGGLLELTTDRLWLLVENSAGAGGTIGRSLGDLEAIVDGVDRHPRLGVCIDSCHWWASGVDVTKPAALDAAVTELDERIGLDRLRCLHVNDAASALGSNVDRHASMGRGLLGAKLGVFLAHPAFQGLPAILETSAPGKHEIDASEIEALRDYHRGGVRNAHRRATR